MTGSPRGADWTDLDRAQDPCGLLDFLDAYAALPEVAAAKRRSFELLELTPAARVLDAGCGTGGDVLALTAVTPHGLVVGVDRSATALRRAADAAAGDTRVRHARADAAALPFPTASFDATRAERVIQHVPGPEQVVSELVRVTRPGGRVVITEATFTLPGGHSAYRHPGARRLVPFLPLFLARAGAAGIVVEEHTVSIEGAPDVLGGIGVAADRIDAIVIHVACTVAR